MAVEYLFPECPLINEYTRSIRVRRTTGISDSVFRKLYPLRSWEVETQGPVPFTWPTRLRTHLYSVLREEITDVPMVPEPWQLQTMHHLARMPRFMCGDAVGLGKTISAILAACWLHDHLPKQKIIILATKSTTIQWADEFRRFSTLRPYVLKDNHKGKTSHAARYEQFRNFLEGDDHDVLVCKYTSLKGTRKKLADKVDDEGTVTKGGKEYMSEEIREFTRIMAPHGDCITLILDEAHTFKGTQGTTRAMVQAFERACARVWVMTATAIKNDLIEMYSIAAAIGIRPFGTMAEFREQFCIYEHIPLGKSGKVKQTLKGYQNIPEFRKHMRPFFLGRSQRQVKAKLPRLTTMFHTVDLNDEQTRLLLDEIPSGKFQLPPAFFKVHGELHERERDIDNDMTALSVMQLVANHPALLDPTDAKKFHTRSLSPKEETLLDLIDGEYRGEKCIVYTTYRSWINRLEHLTQAGHFTDRKFLRITGAENEKQRAEAKRKFQEDPEHDLIFINSAATEGVNLQQAAHLFCLNLPFSWGQLLQLVGRMVRMASEHSACTLHILIARGTIDEFALDTLRGKKLLFEAILGESHSAGLLDDKELYDLTSGMEAPPSDEEFLALMKAHVKTTRMGDFISGEQLAGVTEHTQYLGVWQETQEARKEKKKKARKDAWSEADAAALDDWAVDV